jgi:predicted dehydrogenase
MNRQPTVSRRKFLATAGSALAAPYVITSSALGANGQAPASERITMATIGCGGQGRGDMGGFMGRRGVQMLAVCDPVPDHRNQAKESVDRRYGNRDCAAYNDFREVLVRDDIDAVLIGTPDHWHAIITIEACKHGKDVYCEKPESLTIAEGRAMVEAARRYGRVVSGGSQRVLDDYGALARTLRGGAIGPVQEAFVGVGGPSGDCYLEPQPVPPGLDWEMWLGPAPWRPFHPTLIRGGFRPYRDYSGGGMTDWGAHKFAAAVFAMDLHRTGPVEIIPPDGKDYPHLTYVFANGVRMYHASGHDITYRGPGGELSNRNRGQFPQRPVDMPWYQGGGIFDDFLHCVRTRQRPFRDIEIAHRAATVCHLGNIAYWLKRPLKWSPDQETFVDDPLANRWLDRPKRGTWTV